jgi:hypothetical protein
MAVTSARSVDFEFSGNQPCSWIVDIEAGKALAFALAEQCAHYDGTAIPTNVNNIRTLTE